MITVQFPPLATIALQVRRGWESPWERMGGWSGANEWMVHLPLVSSSSLSLSLFFPLFSEQMKDLIFGATSSVQ